MYVFRLASLEPLSKEIFAVKPERRYQRMYADHLDSILMSLSNSFQSRLVGVRRAVYPPIVLPSPSFHLSYTHMLRTLYHRLSQCLVQIFVESSRSPARS